jgi:hypothetical protein
LHRLGVDLANHTINNKPSSGGEMHLVADLEGAGGVIGNTVVALLKRIVDLIQLRRGEGVLHIQKSTDDVSGVDDNFNHFLSPVMIAWKVRAKILRMATTMRNASCLG